MKLKVVKEGIYGFKLIASIYPPLENGRGVFVFLNSLIGYCGSPNPLFQMYIHSGEYYIEFLQDLKGYEGNIGELSELLFGSPYVLLSAYKEGFVVSPSKELSAYFYSVLCGLFNAAKPNSTGYAVVCKDGVENPIKIILDLEGAQFS